MDRQRWGLAGLLAFEGIVAAYLFGIGASLGFSLSYAIGALVLAASLFLGPQRWQFALLAVFAAYRAFVQTAGGAQLGVEREARGSGSPRRSPCRERQA